MITTIGISLVVALLVATGFSLFQKTPTEKVVERIVTERLGGFSELVTSVDFQAGLFVTGSSTLGIGTTTSGVQPLQSRQGIIIDALNATPTMMTFATTTLTGQSNNGYSGCIQFNSATNSAVTFRLYVGERGLGDETPSLGGTGLIFESGACQ